MHDCANFFYRLGLVFLTRKGGQIIKRINIVIYRVNRQKGQFGENNTYNKSITFLAQENILNMSIKKNLIFSVFKHDIQPKNIPGWALSIV